MIDYREEKWARDNFGVHKSEFEDKPKTKKPEIMPDGFPLLPAVALPSGPIPEADEITDPDDEPTLIEESHGSGFVTRITQAGTNDYHGVAIFAAGPASRDIHLFSENLSQLRGTLQTFASQNVSKADLEHVG